MNWSLEIERVFGDCAADSRASDWEDAKNRFPVGSHVSGPVKLRAPFGLWLDVGAGFPAVLLATRLQPAMRADEYFTQGPRLGDVVSATVCLHADDRQLILTQRPLDEG